MPKYRFLFERLVKQTCGHDIEANSFEEAEESADQIQYLDGSDEDVTHLKWEDEEVQHAEYHRIRGADLPGSDLKPQINGDLLLQAVRREGKGE